MTTDIFALAFTDTETTGLDPRIHDVWEIAAVVRPLGTREDTERLWQVRPDLEKADPEALKINGFHERFLVPDGWDAAEIMPNGEVCRFDLDDVLFDIQSALSKTVMVGSNPAFDDTALKKLLWAHDRKVTWHYRTVDFATLAAGFRYGQAASGAYGGDFAFPSDYPRIPFDSRGLSQAVGVEPPAEGVAHTALGDARWCRDVYDAVTCGAPAVPR